MAALTSVLDPQCVVLGGGIGGNGDLLIKPMEKRLRALVPSGALEILSNSPSAPPALTNSRVAKLRELVPEVAPKQAWTPVAQFAEQGIDGINYGPGATAYAHKQDEQIPIANLHAVYDTLARFLS